MAGRRAVIVRWKNRYGTTSSGAANSSPLTYENLRCAVFAGLLQSTARSCPRLLSRLLGCKIGRRVFMETTDITEFDVVSIGDDTALNSDCGPQTHLFEDRVMKISTVDIGARCTLGGGSIVLYDLHGTRQFARRIVLADERRNFTRRNELGRKSCEARCQESRALGILTGTWIFHARKNSYATPLIAA